MSEWGSKVVGCFLRGFEAWGFEIAPKDVVKLDPSFTVFLEAWGDHVLLVEGAKVLGGVLLVVLKLENKGGSLSDRGLCNNGRGILNTESSSMGLPTWVLDLFELPGVPGCDPEDPVSQTGL